MNLVIDANPVPLQADVDGVIRVRGTRVTLDTIITAFQEGASAEEIAQRYPTVALEDVYSVIGFYLRRRREVEAYLRQGLAEAAALKEHYESRLDPQGIRDRLLSRQESSE